MPKFKGNSDPDEFARSYALAIEASEGGPATIAKCFPLALEGLAIHWFWVLDPGTIHTWSQLLDLFRSNFQGTFIEPVTSGSLFTIRQGPDETLRDYFQRFSQTKAQIRGISDSSVINTATQGLAEGPLYD